jgi:hypothetical protein
MRLSGLSATATILLLPLAVFAQQSTPPPSPAISTVSHISPVSPPAIHSSIVSAPHTPVTTTQPGAQGVRVVAKTSHRPSAPPSNEKVASQSGANSQPENKGPFSFLRWYKPDKCRSGSCAPSPSPRLTSQTVPSFPPVTGLSCTVVALPNPAIPCNMYAPCCP